MIKLKQIIKHNIRFVVFAAALCLSLYSAAGDAYAGNLYAYLFAGGLGKIIFILELVTVHINKQKLYLPIKMQYDRSYSLTEERLMHLLIPLSLYLSALLAVGSYLNNGVKLSIILLVGILGFILLKNINNYYLRKIDSELRTHFVYDLAKFFIFINFVISWQVGSVIFLQPVIWVVAVTALAVFISITSGLQIQRLELAYIQLCLLLGIGFFSLLLIIIYAVGLNLPKASFIAIVLFYIFQSLVIHVMARDLSYKQVLQYIVILAACIFTVTKLG